MVPPTKEKLWRPFVIEMVIYGLLLTAYFLIVLNTIGGWLADVFERNLTLYAVLALVLIVAQAVVLDHLTEFILNIFGLKRIE